MWKHLLAIIVGLGLVLSFAIDAPPQAAAAQRSATAEAAAVVDVGGVPDAMAAMIDWAMALFADADLALPSMRFVHNGTDTEPCSGRAGMHHVVDGVSVVELCTSDVGVATRIMILHETAHAWTRHALTDEARERFRALRGFEHWRDYAAAPWHENGTEQAAEILVWGLMDRPIRIVRIDQATCDDLLAGYRILTGAEPLHGFSDHC
ncbi:MAG: hypothetical protein ACE367_08450 [Acidimicrobiales bacterium]